MAFWAGTIVTSLAACGEPTPDDINPTATDGAWTGTGAYEEGGDGADETAGGEGGPYFNGCLPFPVEGSYPGVRHQCGGLTTARIQFDVVGVSAALDGTKNFGTLLEFGENKDDDSYLKPKVMACCYPIEDQVEPWGEPHLTYCYHDLVEQGCRSMVARLRSLLDEEDTPVLAKPQINRLADWLAENQQACYDAFWTDSGNESFWPDAWFPGATIPEPFPSHTWVLPASAETNNVKNIELELVQPWITDVHLPPPAEQLECFSQGGNNDVEFIMGGPGSGFTLDLSQGAASIEGPPSSYGSATGDVQFASTATSCDLCSYMSFDPTKLSLDGLVLDSAELAEVGVQGGIVSIDDLRIALYKPVPAYAISSNTYRIKAGSALFSVAASAGGAAWSLTGYNAGEFDVTYVPGQEAWVVQEFEVSYTDASGGAWALTVGDLTFAE